MEEWAWINGTVTPLSEARVGVEDRGFQFADGVYEVIRLYGGRPFALDMHLDRLERSCRGIELAPPDRDRVTSAIESILSRARLADGMVYLQFTRGVSPRSHVFPVGGGGTAGTLVCYARGLEPVPPPGTSRGITLVTVPDERWKRCWVKSIALLPNVLTKSHAASVGADEAAFVDEGVVTECSTSNLFAVLGGDLVTHPVGPRVLPGITRAILLDVATELGIPTRERKLTENEVQNADELFISSTNREISWVATWNGRPVSNRCGAITLLLHRGLQQRIAQKARNPKPGAGNSKSERDSKTK
jgi:D-alanine transaminase